MLQDNDGVLETVQEREEFVSKYGVNSTIFDFTEFNRSRADTGIKVSILTVVCIKWTWPCKLSLVIVSKDVILNI